MSEKKLKSAYELAMERLSKKDPELKEEKLTDEMKREISDIRSEYEAKIAEREIMFKSKINDLMREVAGPEAMIRRAELESDHRTAIEVLRKAQETKIQKVRDKK